MGHSGYIRKAKLGQGSQGEVYLARARERITSIDFYPSKLQRTPGPKTLTYNTHEGDWVVEADTLGKGVKIHNHDSTLTIENIIFRPETNNSLVIVNNGNQSHIGRGEHALDAMKVYGHERGHRTERDLAAYFRETMVQHLGLEGVLPIRDHHSGSEHHRPYTIMPYLEGGSFDLLVDEGIQAPSFVLRQARKISQALKETHEWGLTHRDIKPGNILKDKQGNIYISDYGLARISDEKQGIMVSGTPGYIAPESYRNIVTPASDIWSVGVILEQLATGQATSNNPLAAWREAEARERQRITPKDLAFPGEEDKTELLADVINRCLCPVHDRFQNASEMADFLKNNTGP